MTRAQQQSIHGPTLETERLILRPPELHDFEPLAAMASDPETMRYITGEPLDKLGSWRMLAGNVGAWVLKGCSPFSVIEKASGAWIGRIGPIDIPGWPGTEVSWMLSREFRGKGYAYEAVRASMDFVVDTLNWRNIIHSIEPENLASRKLAEKLGSRILRQERLAPPFDKNLSDIWGQSAAEWRERRTA